VEQISDRRASCQGRALRVLKKKSSSQFFIGCPRRGGRVLESVFFFQKPCPSSLLFQVRLLNKKPTEVCAEVAYSKKQHEELKKQSTTNRAKRKNLPEYHNQ